MVFFQRNGGAEVKMQFSLCDLQWLDTRSGGKAEYLAQGVTAHTKL